MSVSRLIVIFSVFFFFYALSSSSYFFVLALPISSSSFFCLRQLGLGLEVTAAHIADTVAHVESAASYTVVIQPA